MNDTLNKEYTLIEPQHVLMDYVCEFLVLMPFMLLAKNFPILGMDGEVYSIFVFWIIYFLMYVYFILKNHTTFGKQLNRYRIVKYNLRPIDWKNALLRELIPLGLFGIFLIQYLFINNEIDLRAETFADNESLKQMFGASGQIAKVQYGMHFIFLLVIWKILDFVTMFLNKQGKTMSDFIANTLVVRPILRENIVDEN